MNDEWIWVKPQPKDALTEAIKWGENATSWPPPGHYLATLVKVAKAAQRYADTCAASSIYDGTALGYFLRAVRGES